MKNPLLMFCHRLVTTREHLLVKEDRVASTCEMARNEDVNHLYNVRFICTVPVLFALRVLTCSLT